MLFAVLHFDRNAEPPGWLLSMSGTPEQPWMSTHRLGKLGPVRHFVRTVEVAAVLSHTGFAKVSMPLLKSYARLLCIWICRFIIQDILSQVLLKRAFGCSASQKLAVTQSLCVNRLKVPTDVQEKHVASCLKSLMPGPDNVPELDALGGPAMEAALDRILSVILESTNPTKTSKWLNKLVPGEAPFL